MADRSAEPGDPTRMDGGPFVGAAQRHGCWIHCYPDPSRDTRRFIVRESFESGALALSSVMTWADSDTERVLVAVGANPREAHARVQEAIERGTAFLILRDAP